MLQRGKSISMANEQTTRMRRLVVLLGMAVIFSPCLHSRGHLAGRSAPQWGHFSVRYLKVTGDLTIHATTQEMVLDVEGPSASVRDSRGNEKIGSSGMRRWNRVGLRSPMRSLSASILS